MKLQEIINFEINNVLVEFKTKFNLEYFKSIKNIEEKVEYAQQHLKVLGSSTRIAFLLSNRFVLKTTSIERDYNNEYKKGIAQNKAEIEIYKNIKSDLITKIYDFAYDYTWIITELVRPIKNDEEFKKLTNINFLVFSSIIYDIETFSVYNDITEQMIIIYTDLYEFENISEEKSRYELYINELKNNSFLIDVISIIEKMKLDPTDVSVLEHWGKTSDNRVVLLDYGATQEVIKQYYKS